MISRICSRLAILLEPSSGWALESFHNIGHALWVYDDVTYLIHKLRGGLSGYATVKAAELLPSRIEMIRSCEVTQSHTHARGASRFRAEFPSQFLILTLPHRFSFYFRFIIFSWLWFSIQDISLASLLSRRRYHWFDEDSTDFRHFSSTLSPWAIVIKNRISMSTVFYFIFYVKVTFISSLYSLPISELRWMLPSALFCCLPLRLSPNLSESLSICFSHFAVKLLSWMTYIWTF